jgi:hypothetical protein
MPPRNLSTVDQRQHSNSFDLSHKPGESLGEKPEKHNEYGRIIDSIDRNGVLVTNAYDSLSRFSASAASAQVGRCMPAV